MQGGFERAIDARRRILSRAWSGAVSVWLAGLILAGCAAGAQQTATFAAKPNATVAFESIDGPPPPVFQNLVQSISDEVQSRRIPVVTRSGPADYRVRGYLAAYAAGGRMAVSWVWDVYDAGGRRALRIEGEAPIAGKAGDPWGSVNDAVVRQIARAGMERLAVFLQGSAPGGGPAVAAAEPVGVAGRSAQMAAFSDSGR